MSRRRPWRGRPLLLVTAGLVALVAGLVFLFFFSRAFVVKDIQVTGAEGSVAEDVERAAMIPHGRPLARVSEPRVSERVLTDPRVESVDVARDWPDGVTLSLTLREPAVALRGGGATWLADDQGVVYEQVDRASNRLPLMTVQGDPSELHPDVVRGLAELWRLRPDPMVLGGELGAPAVDAEGNVTMSVENLSLTWGAPSQNEKKWQVVEALLGHDSVDATAAQPMSIDVSVPDTPVVVGLPLAPED